MTSKEVLFRLRLMHPEITIVWADSAYAGQLVTWARTYLNLTIKTVSRPKNAPGFIVLPRRWVVERSHAWVMHAPPARTRLRTAYPALGIADYLGSDHPHDQAHHPPKLPQERTAGLPRSPTRLITAALTAVRVTQRSASPRTGLIVAPPRTAPPGNPQQQGQSADTGQPTSPLKPCRSNAELDRRAVLTAIAQGRKP